MFTQRKWIILLALLSLAASAQAGTLVYAVSLFGPFGTIDVSTGAFNQIGPTLSDPLGGLVLGPNGYLGVSISGNLDSINPATGAISIIGATGLGFQADTMTILNGTVYETDLSNNIYTVNTTTGVAQLIGNTGIPPCPPPPLAGDESLFTANGNLYETFDTLDPSTFTPIIDPELYQINSATGQATLIGPTAFAIDAAIDLNGTVYAFTADAQVLSLDPATGSTTFLTNYDPSAAIVGGVAPTPEPSSLALAGTGMAALLVFKRRRRRS
jgi:outer membrane protein assembly factor BamB